MDLAQNFKLNEYWQMISSEIRTYICKDIPIDDVDEVLQEVLCVVIVKFDRVMKQGKGEYLDYSDFRPWVYKIAINKILNKTKNNIRNAHLDLDQMLNQLNSEDEIERVITKLVLQDALSRLSPEEKKLFRLRIIEELTFHEIASLTGKTEGALMTQLHRLKNKLRNNLKYE